MRFTLLLSACLLCSTSAQAQQSSWPCAGNVDPSYVRLSEGTGGKVLLLKPAEAAGAGAEMAARSRHPETVFRAAGTFEEGVYEYAVPVDSTIESVYFFVSMQCLQRATLVTPAGVALAIDSPTIEYHQFDSLRLFVIPNPEPGLWRVTMAGRGMLSLIVKAKSTLRLEGVRFLREGEPLAAESKLGKNLRLQATMSGNPGEVSFAFMGRDGIAIAAANLARADDADKSRTYTGDVTTPSVEFRLAVSGHDSDGFPFQRVESQLSIDPAR